MDLIDNTVTSDKLQTIMDDYNNMYGTAFTTDNFSAYYDDINLRMMAQDISGIQDIYPSIESICIPAFLALNVVAGFRVFKTAKK